MSPNPSGPLLPGTGTSPRGLEATYFEYRGLHLHDRTNFDWYRIKKISGLLGLPDIRDQREQNPSSHGERPLNSWFGGKTIVIEGQVEAYNAARLRDMQTALKSVFGLPPSGAGPLQENPLYIRTPSSTTDLQINCRATSFVQDEVWTSANFFREFQITLRASFPFWQSASSNINDTVPVIVSTMGRTYDRTHPALYDKSLDVNWVVVPGGASNSFTITNSGNMQAYPVYRLTGLLTNLTLTNQTNSQALRLTGSVPTGDYWDVDIANKLVYNSTGVNKFGQILASSDWPVLEPGANNFLIALDSYDGSANIRTTWRHTYL